MKAQSGFSKHLAVVTLLHGVLIGLLWVVPAIPGCSRPPEPPIIPLDLVVEVPPGDEMGEEVGPEPEVTPQPELPEPEPEPVPEVVTLKPPPKPKPSPPKEVKPPVAKPKPAEAKPVAKTKTKIEVSRKRVKNPYGSSTSTRKPVKALSAAEIRKRLAAGARIGDHTSDVDDDYLYLEIVRRTFYQAWIQPSSIPIDGLSAKVDIELSSNGGVLSARLTRSSGNAVMDESVMRAVKAVHRIPNLSPEFIRRRPRLPVVFELTGDR